MSIFDHFVNELLLERANSSYGHIYEFSDSFDTHDAGSWQPTGQQTPTTSPSYHEPAFVHNEHITQNNRDPIDLLLESALRQETLDPLDLLLDSTSHFCSDNYSQPFIPLPYSNTLQRYDRSPSPLTVQSCEGFPCCSDPSCDDIIPCPEEVICCDDEHCADALLPFAETTSNPLALLENAISVPCEKEECVPHDPHSPPICFNEDCAVPPCTEEHDLLLAQLLAPHGEIDIEDLVYKCDDPRCQPDVDRTNFYNPHNKQLFEPFPFTHHQVPQVPPWPTCKWITKGVCCNMHFTDSEQLQEHVESAHIQSLNKEGGQGDKGFFCHWAGCDRNHMSKDSDTSECYPTSGDDQETTRGGTPAATKWKYFPGRPKLKRHVQTHTNYCPFKCEICAVRTKTRDAMIKHRRTHTGEKPYACSFPACDKSFATSTELKTHQTTHTGLKPHVCPHCSESFADSSNLSKHKKIHFSARWTCEDCNKTMKRWDHMKRHFEHRNHMTHLDTPEALETFKNRSKANYVPVFLGDARKKRKSDDE